MHITTTCHAPPSSSSAAPPQPQPALLDDPVRRVGLGLVALGSAAMILILSALGGAFDDVAGGPRSVAFGAEAYLFAVGAAALGGHRLARRLPQLLRWLVGLGGLVAAAGLVFVVVGVEDIPRELAVVQSLIGALVAVVGALGQRLLRGVDVDAAAVRPGLPIWAIAALVLYGAGVVFLLGAMFR